MHERLMIITSHIHALSLFMSRSAGSVIRRASRDLRISIVLCAAVDLEVAHKALCPGNHPPRYNRFVLHRKEFCISSFPSHREIQISTVRSCKHLQLGLLIVDAIRRFQLSWKRSVIESETRRVIKEN